ncbi:probable tubulin polyglutamylase TTLL2 [Leptopilina heterotoma]|uniref:probable tubulin polyglutamylase TTLL2 n=1 Tax=Leptopilina heterotoma TaxID=63436 RepID=UPI001CA89CEC|nr:probable tubulin polyglutamylase TTLL2 [Leptopilina heterotoma]
MKKIYGSAYDFSPIGYNLPSEYTRLASKCSLLETDERIWIYKPVGQSQGKGIFLFRKLSDLSYDSVAVVQRYIENPLLIGGYKFDLRLYVCVPSYYPLTIYLYKEGIARFATEKFSLGNLSDPLRHLTNFSLNKWGPGYSEKKERVGAGCKWSLRQLRRYLEQSGYRDWFLWQQVTCVIILTILSQSASIPKSSNCFEFFGFDILIDDNLKPWLLEVNVSPALSNDCEVDLDVKKPLLHDLFDLLGLPVRNTGLSLFTMWTSAKNMEDNDDSTGFVHGRYSKGENSLGSETLALVDVCSNTRHLVRQGSEGFSDHWHQYNTLLNEKILRHGFKGSVNDEYSANFVWDNGKDWRIPNKKEGGWIRIHPVTTMESTNSDVLRNSFMEPPPRVLDKQIKITVSYIQKYLKVAKEIQSQYGKQGDDICNEMLQRALNINEEIWLPEK